MSECGSSMQQKFLLHCEKTEENQALGAPSLFILS
jgi:hypothetical protein